MPRFFFDSAHGRDYRKDETGSEFATPEDALVDAHGAADEIRAALDLIHMSPGDRAIVVRDEQGRVIGSVALAASQIH